MSKNRFKRTVRKKMLRDTRYKKAYKQFVHKKPIRKFFCTNICFWGHVRYMCCGFPFTMDGSFLKTNNTTLIAYMLGRRDFFEEKNEPVIAMRLKSRYYQIEDGIVRLRNVRF